MGVIEVVKKQERQIGLQEGLQKGRLEERARAEKLLQEERARAEAKNRESAIKMLKNGFDVELISDIIGLSKEEIEKLKQGL